jgi:hypothetical protein
MHYGNRMPIAVTKDGQRIPTCAGQFVRTLEGDWYQVVEIIDYNRDDGSCGKRLSPSRRKAVVSPCDRRLDHGRTTLILFEEIVEVSNRSPEERLIEQQRYAVEEELAYYNWLYGEPKVP